MTSNQIANESNRISERRVAEEERHNKAMEGLQAASNEIERIRVGADISYKNESLMLQKSIEDKKLELESALGTEKNRISAELAELEANKAEVDRQYKAEQIKIQRDINYINQQMVGENIRNNTENNRINWYRNFLTNKDIEYKNTQFRENIGLRREELAQQKLISQSQIASNERMNTERINSQELINQQRISADKWIAGANQATTVETTTLVNRSREAINTANLEQQAGQNQLNRERSMIETLVNGAATVTGAATKAIPYMIQ